MLNGKNILQYIGEDSVALSQIDSFDNFEGGLSLLIAMQNIEKFKEYYGTSNFTIKSYDDYIDFLFLWKLSLYKNALPIINEDRKEEFQAIFEFFNELFEKYIIADIIKFINNNYEKICDNQVVAYVTFKYIMNKLNGIEKKVINEFAYKQPLFLYRNIKELIKYFKGNVDIISILFDKKHFDIYIVGIYNVLFDGIIELKKHKEFANIIKGFEEMVIDKMLEIETAINLENVFDYRFVYIDFCDFLKAIQSIHYLEKQRTAKKIEELFQQRVSESGSRFSFCTSAEEIEKHIGLTDLKYEVLQLTYTFDKNKKDIVSVFENCMNEEDSEDKLIDSIRGNRRTNSYFTNSRLMKLQQTVVVYLVTFNQYILNSDRMCALFEQLKLTTASVFNKIRLDIEETDLLSDIDFIGIASYNLRNAVTEKMDAKIIKMYCYLVIMYGCSLIEKLLRLIYVAKNETQKFFDIKKLTLGDLLNVKNETMLDLLGYHQIRCMRYYLHIDEENGVGKNIRNKFAHLNEVTSKDYKPDTAILVLWLLLCVVNSMTLKFLVEN